MVLLRLSFQQELILEHFDSAHDFDLVDVVVAETMLFQKSLECAAGFTDHFDQQVVASRNPEYVNHFTAFAKAVGDFAGCGGVCNLDADHRVGLVANRHRIGEGDNFQCATFFHRLHTVADCAFRDLERTRNVLVGQAPILLQHFYDAAIEIVLGGGDTSRF